MKKIVVLSGSGISAESGISTFRGGNGLWDNCRVEDVATPHGWMLDPEYVLNFYNERRAQLRDAAPNAAHIALAELEKDFQVCVITQNVDNLHERAGSSNIIHLHGELTKVRPENCYTGRDGYSEKFVQDIGYEPVHLGDKGANGVQLRPHIVWFGEAVPNIEKAAKEVMDADILLIVGTSLAVYPAAGLWQYAPYDCKIFVVDPESVPTDGNKRITHIKDVATKGVRKFVETVKAL